MAGKTRKTGRTRVETKAIKISPSPRLAAYLAAMAKTDLWEKTPTGVAAQLVREGVRRAIEQGVISAKLTD